LLGRIQVEAERVVGVVGRDEDAVGERVAGAGLRAEEDRLGRGLVGRFAAVVQGLERTSWCVSLMSKRNWPNRPARSDGVTSRLNGEKLKRSAVDEAVVVVGAGAAGLGPVEVGIDTRRVGVTS
jgi:hypothetical protein